MTLTKLNRSAPLKLLQASCFPRAARSTSASIGLCRARAFNISPLSSGVGRGAYKVLSKSFLMSGR